MDYFKVNRIHDQRLSGHLLVFKMVRTRVKNSRTSGSKSASKVINRLKKLRMWEDDVMTRAIDAVKSGRMGTNRAALEYAVSRTMLIDRLAGRVIHGVKMGAKPYLSNQEKQELVEFLLNCVKMGYGKTRERCSEYSTCYSVEKS